MMKNVLNISALSVICVVCAPISASHGASTVRSLGGDGTYNSATSAAAAKTSGSAITAARAGSVRVSPTTTGTSSKVTTTPASSNATTSRLSIGKYLGGATSVSGGSIKTQNPAGGSTVVTKPGTSGGDFSGDLSALDSRISDLETRVGDLADAGDNSYNKTDIDDMLGGKQDALLPGDYISIDANNEIILDLDALEKDLSIATGQTIEMDVVNNVIGWRDDKGWHELIAISALTGAKGEKGDPGEVGPQGHQGEKGEKGDPGDATVDLENYFTKDEMNAELTKAVDAAKADMQTTIATTIANAVSSLDEKYATADQGRKAETALQPGDKPNDGKQYVLMTNGGVETWVEVVY